MGFKIVIWCINSDYEILIREMNVIMFMFIFFFIDNFLYDQDVYVGYVFFNWKLSKFIGLIIGVCYEYIIICGVYWELE